MARQRVGELWRGQVRLPEPLAQWVRERAAESYRSINAEFVEVVREAKNAADARKAAQ